MAFDYRSSLGISKQSAALCAALIAVIYPASVSAQTSEIGRPLAEAMPDNCETIPADRQIRLANNPFSRPEPAAGYANESKAAAILGGTRSKLEEMRMAQASPGQSAQALPAAALPSEGETDVNSGSCANLAVTPPMAFQDSEPIPENAILGTLSVAIKSSPFDRDWAAVSSKKASRMMQRSVAATGARSSGDRAAQIEAVNRWVNRRITYGEDRDIYGRADYWAPAGETLRRGVGDCEDFAIAKMELLSALGVGRDKMRLVIARDLVRNADHAILVVTLAEGAFMLDNMTDRLLDARLPNDYRPIMSFSQNAKWVHGYAMPAAQPVRMASANTVPQHAANSANEVFTVTQQPELPVLSLALLSVPLVLPSELSARA